MGRVVALKGIRIDYEPNDEIVELIKQYAKAVQDFLNIAVEKGITSLGRINGYRQKVREKYGLGGATSVLAMKDALAIYKAWRRRKGRKSKPIVKRKFMKVMNGYNAKLMSDNRLRVTKQRGDYIYLKLKVGKYQQVYLDMVRSGKLSLGIIVVTPKYCVFPVKKEIEPYTPEGVLAVDINEKSIEGLVIKEGEVQFCSWDLRDVFEASVNCFERFRAFQRRYLNRHRLHKKVAQKWFSKRNKRIEWRLHNIINEIIGLAEKEKFKIIMEDLKHIKKGINRRELRVNKHNGKLQRHRKLSRALLGRLNRWMVRKIQSMAEYKANWRAVPISYVNPAGTSSRCPRCGSALVGCSDWHLVRCPNCQIEENRHLVACLNIALTEDESMRFMLDWGAMQGLLASSPQVGLTGQIT
jgi:putative transposase